MESSTVFFTAAQALQGQKAIGGDAQAGVVMEAGPVASFVVTQPEFLLEFQVVPLDAPAPFDRMDEGMEGDVFGERRKPVAGRFGVAAGPFDDQPFGVSGAVVVGGDHAHTGKSVGQFFRCALPPGDGAIRPCRQRLRQGTHADGWMRRIAHHPHAGGDPGPPAEELAG